jgi:hypothetical protein
MGKLGIKTIDFELSGHLSNSNVVRCHFFGDSGTPTQVPK